MDQNNNIVPINDELTDDCIPASLIFQDEAAYCLQDTFYKSNYEMPVRHF